MAAPTVLGPSWAPRPWATRACGLSAWPGTSVTRWQRQPAPRFSRGLISWVGFRQVGVPFVRRERAGGVTKYRYGRLLKLAFDTITAFSSLPALCITLLAGASAAGSAALTAALVLLWAV